jgi:CzcA family heavy metal efflux pump
VPSGIGAAPDVAGGESVKAIVGWSLSFRVLVVGLAVALMAIGVAQLRSTSVDVLPEYSPPYVEIQTEALGLSAAEVEQFVTVPMEALMLSNVAWVETVRSESVPGLSSIVLIFEPGTDLMRARQVVQERLTEAHALPKVSKAPQMIQPLSSASRVMIVSLSSQTISMTDLSVLARWNVRPRLMGVTGVANVAIWGQRERQLQVLVDPARLHTRGVTLDEVIRTTGNALWVSPLSYLKASTPGAGGFIDTPNQRLGIRHVLPIRTPDDLSRVPVEGQPNLRLGDVATVVEDHQPMIGDASTAEGPALLLIVEKLPGQNTLNVSRGVEEALAAMQPGLSGVTIDSSIYRPATFVESAIANLGLTILIALILIAVIIAAFLLQWRIVVISIVAVTFSLIAAALVLHVLGATVNAMVIAGLVVALAVVLDDAIIDVDNAIRRLRERNGGESPPSFRDVLIASVVDVRRSAVYATVVILLVVAPVFVIEGVTGSFLQPFAIAFALAVIVSMIVGLTLTPALASLLLSRAKIRRDEPRMIRALQRGYQALLSRTLKRPAPALIVVGIVAIVGLVAVPQLAASVAPTFQERDLLVDIGGAPGTSQPAMNRIAAQATAELRAIPGVRSVGAHVGRAIMSDQVVNINSGQLWINIDPVADYESTLASVREVLAGYPGLRLAVDTYLTAQAGDIEGDPTNPIAVRLFGPNLGELQKQAESVQAAIANVPGVVSPRVLTSPQEPTVEVEVNLDNAFRYGVKPGDVRRAAATLISGLEVGNLFEEQKVFEVMVVGVPEIRHSLKSIGELLIDTPSGGQVRLDAVADVRIVPSPVKIQRSSISRYMDVVADVEGRSVGAVQADVQRALTGIAFPIEYHPELSTAYAEAQADFQRLLGVIAAAAIAVFLVLQAAFGSWRLAAIALVALPVALVGSVLAAWIFGGELTLGSMIGFLAVLAITARNQLALVGRLQLLERNGMAFGPTLVLRGARERVGPILMTALATGLAFLAIILLGERPGLELLRPMAVVVIGGLITSTLLNLFIVPTLYLGLRASPQSEGVQASIPQAGEPQPAGVQ